MKKFIALLISTSLLTAPMAFAADDQQGGNQSDAVMQQQMANNDQGQTPVTKPVKKAAHHCKCHSHKCHKHHAAKKPAAAAQ
jgi:uncharacterized protein YdeI (BOF family)